MARRPRTSPRDNCIGILPQLPSCGTAGRLGTKELVSALSSGRSEQQQGSPGKGILYRNVLLAGNVETKTSSTLQSVQNARLLCSRKGAFRAEEIVSHAKALFRHDNVHLIAPNMSTSDFDGHDKHDEALNQEAPAQVLKNSLDIIEESDTNVFPQERFPNLRSSVFCDPSTSSKSQPHKVTGCHHRSSLRSLLADSETRGFSPPRLRAKPSKLAPHRVSSLRSSFSHTLAEVEQRVNNIELALGHDEHALIELDRTSASLEPYPDAEVIEKAYEKAQLDSLQIRAPSVMPFVNDEEQGSIPCRSERKEVILCAAQVNLYRWLCGLPPVKLAKPCLTMCDLIADVLLPRCQPAQGNPLLVKEMASLGTALGQYMMGGDDADAIRAVVLHGEGSLLSAVQQSIIGYNSQTDVHHHSHHQHTRHNVDNSRTSRANLAADLARRVALQRETAERQGVRPRSTFQRARSKSGRLDPMHLLPPTHFDQLPRSLQPLGLLWELQVDGSSWRETIPRNDRKRAILKVGRMHGNGIMKHLPDIPAARMRTEACKQAAAEELGAGLAAKKSSAFWGDLEGCLNSRRYLLNPSLKIFGASRQHDTCVLWTGDLGRRLFGLESWDDSTPSNAALRTAQDNPSKATESLPASQDPLHEKDAICFPPTGFVPLEVIQDESRIFWTIMPNSRLYQPTENVQVHMWRASIHTPLECQRVAVIAGHNNNKEDREWTAERREEVQVSDLKVDCSSKGNPFCVIFRPELAQLKDGDQFEVQLSGLCGSNTELTFFHHFCAPRQRRLDEHLIESVSKLRDALTHHELWRIPPVVFPREQFVPAKPEKQEVTKFAPPATNNGSKNAPFDIPGIRNTDLGPVSTAQIGLVSHPDTDIHVDSCDVNIMLSSDSLLAITPALYIARISVNEEIPRAAQVCHIDDSFFVRMKLPMSCAKYELHFLVVPKAAPEMMVPHPLKYKIATSELSQNLLITLQHPLAQKFGFGAMLPTAQIHKISVLSPVMYRISPGQSFFLLHTQELVPPDFDDERCRSAAAKHSDRSQQPALPQDTTGSTLFSSRLCKFTDVNLQKKGMRTKIERTNWASDLHEALANKLVHNCQDSFGDVHLDVSVGGRYVHRLKRRHDFPELFEGMLNFQDADLGCRVEVFLRRPKQQGENYAPQKIGEWLVCLQESVPEGF